MHPVQKSALNLRHIYAPHAKSSPKSEAHLCTPCIKFLPFFRLVFQVLGWFFQNLGQDFQVFGWPALNLRQVILIF